MSNPTGMERRSTLTLVREKINSKLPKNGKKGEKKDGKKASLVSKMVGVISLLLICALIAGGSTASWVASNSIRQEIQFAGEQLVTGLAGSITTTISQEGGQGELQLALNKILEKDHGGRIEDSYILDKTFKILAAKDSRLAGNPYTGSLKFSNIEGVQIFKGRKSVTTVVAPVQWGKTKKVTLGYVVFEFGERAVEEARNSIIFWFAAVFLVAFIATFLVTRMVMKRLLKPLVRLSDKVYQFAQGDIQVNVEKVSGNDEIAVLTNSIALMIGNTRQFVRFSNPALVDLIVKRGNPDRAEEVKVLILFGDAVKFSTLASSLTADETVNILNRYFTLYGFVITEYGGIIDKFIGDGSMAIFGYANQGNPKENAQNAIRGTVFCQDLYLVANIIAIDKSWPVLTYRFGMATGKVVIGPMGAKGTKMEFTCIGTAVNLSARLEPHAPRGRLKLDKFSYSDGGGEDLIQIENHREWFDIKGFEREKEKEEGIHTYDFVDFSQPEERARRANYLRAKLRDPRVREVLQMSEEEVETFIVNLPEHLRAKLRNPEIQEKLKISSEEAEMFIATLVASLEETQS